MFLSRELKDMPDLQEMKNILALEQAPDFQHA